MSAQLRNPQTIAISSAASSINVSNPSRTTFMQVWGYSLSSAINTANIGFLNGLGTIGGYQTVAVGTPLTCPSNGNDPVFTVDPNANLVISNPNTSLIAGWVRISN